MKIAKKRRGLIASIALSAMVLSGCTVADGWEMTKSFFTDTVWGTVQSWFGKAPEKQDKKQDDKNDDTPTPVEKKDVSISIAMEDGKQYNEGEFVAPSISVTPSTLTPLVAYYKGEQSLGSEAPQTVGDYKIVAKTEENEEYNAGLASKSFLIRKVPSISFFYGNENPLEADHQFDLAEGDYNIYAKSSVEGANFTYSYLDSQGTALSAKPSQPGTYYFVADVARTSTIGSVSKSIRYSVVDSSSGIVAVDPVIKFFYKGSEACLESNWLIGGYADSQFSDSEFDINDLSYTVDPANATYEETWTLNDQPIAKPTSNPLAEGTYAITITVSESEVAHAAVKWAGFVIKASTKVDPVIKFFYNGSEACTESNWLNSGYADSQYFANEFDVTKLTYTVTPNLDAVVSWTLDEAPIAAPSNPLAAGTYAMTVTVAAGATNNEAVRWALFVIKESGQGKVDPAIKFFYDGQEKCLENNWLNSGYSDSQFFANEFDVTKLSYTVTPQASAEVSWTLNDNPISAPTNPLAAGTYAMTVNVAASDTVNAAVKWALFAIKESAPGKVDPQIQFFYDGAEKCISGSRWLNEGYGDTQFYASEFDVSKLTYTVTPEASAEVSWTLNEVAHAAPSNPLDAGTWAMTVTVAASDTVNAGSAYALFAIKADKTDPTIKFFYDGAEKCLESNWLNGGYADSQFYANEFDVTKLSYTVTPELEAEVSWTLDEVAHSAPSNPLDAGTWAMTVSVAAGADNNAAVKWALFVIKEAAPEKQDPTIKFFYDGAEKCISGSRWLNEGYGDTQFYASEFDVSKLTYTVTPEASAEVSWTLNEVAHAAPSNPLDAGTWAMTVTVAASDTVNAGSAYALFAIKADKTDPVIKFFYDGQEKCLENNWLNSGYGDSQFFAADFDVTKLTYTVTPELAAEVSWTLDEVAHAAPSNPLDVGTWAMTVSVAAGDDNNAAVKWALFAIKAPAAPTPGSAELPYTVAEARAAIDANEGITDVYTAGIVTNIAYAYSSQNKNMSFFFSDDGTTGSEIEAYKLSADEDPNVEVGDYVIVKGNLTKYNSTYEVNSGCTLTTHTKAVVNSVEITGNATQTEYAVGATYNHNGLAAVAHLSTGVNKDVSSVAEWVISPSTASADDESISITATYKGVTSAAKVVSVTVSSNPSVKVYSKTTSIAVGDSIAIACEGASKYLTSISTTSTKYGIGSDIPASFTASSFDLTVVEGNEAGTFAFKTSANKYLCWSSGNSLDVSDTLNANSSWDVSIDSNGNATILNHADNARQIWWNVGSPRFACYTGKTNGDAYNIPQIYKLA